MRPHTERGGVSAGDCGNRRQRRSAPVGGAGHMAFLTPLALVSGPYSAGVAAPKKLSKPAACRKLARLLLAGCGCGWDWWLPKGPTPVAPCAGAGAVDPFPKTYTCGIPPL